MRPSFAGLLAMAFALSSVPAGAAPPESAFAALPEMSMVRLSPNGQRVARANDPGGAPLVVVFDLATGMGSRTSPSWPDTSASGEATTPRATGASGT